MLISSIIFCLLNLQIFSLHIPSRFKSLLKTEYISDEAKDKILKSFLKFINEAEDDIIENRTDNRTKPDNRTENRTKPDNRTDNRTKLDNRTDNRTKPYNRTDNRTKPDNRTDNRTKPDNRTDNRTKPDNRTDNRTKPDNRTDNRTKPDNRTDNRTKPDNGTKPDNRTDNRTDPKSNNRTDKRTKPHNKNDNRTDPKPDNRTVNRTKPDNRTEPKPDNRTIQKPELVGINTKAIQNLSWQNISLVFSNNDTNLSLIENLVAWTKNKPSNTLKLRCFEKNNNYTIKCIGDFSRIQTGIYIVNSLGYNHSSITLSFPITFYVQKRSGYLY